MVACGIVLGNWTLTMWPRNPPVAMKTKPGQIEFSKSETIDKQIRPADVSTRLTMWDITKPALLIKIPENKLDTLKWVLIVAHILEVVF